MLEWIKGLLGVHPIADNREVHTICIYFPDGFRREEAEKLDPAFETADVHDLLQPTSINLYFAVVEGLEEKIASVNSTLNSLSQDNNFRKFNCGSARGECVGEFDSNGLLTSTPIGEVITEASRKAWNIAETT